MCQTQAYTMFYVVYTLSLVSLATSQFYPHCAPGREGGAITHLFSWNWTDIARECESFLSPKGYCGVQISPPNEHRIVTQPNRPWWERYQPVSYKLDSASGDRQEFINMVQRCNKVDVRVYVDVVINHLCAADAGQGYGTAGSYYNTQTGEFRGIPYSNKDFGPRCPTESGNIEDYYDEIEARDCRLLNLIELDSKSEYVRSKIAGFFDDMLKIGVDGIRTDAAKHMWPDDLKAILLKTRNSTFGGPQFVYQEVIDFTSSDEIKASHYAHLGRVTEFKYGLRMSEVFKTGKRNLTQLKTFQADWKLLDDKEALVFIDNHDNQRGHGGAGDIITFKNPKAYKMAAAFMLSWPYGVPRIMSSYNFTEDWMGPPSVSQNDGDSCGNGWICEHRWREVANMVAWRNKAGYARVTNWWSNGYNQIAYSRGSQAFIAFNGEKRNMDEVLITGLKPGVYCDVISGNLVSGACTGLSITVKGDFTARVQIDKNADTPVLAFHAGSIVPNEGSVIG